MALNFQTLKTRAITALLFVAVMLAGLLWNAWAFLLLFSVIHFGCWFEYLKLVEKICSVKIDIGIKYFFAICGFTLMIGLGSQHYCADFYKTFFGYNISLKWSFFLFLIICLGILIFKNRQINNRSKWMSFAGFIYISLSLGLMFRLYELTEINSGGTAVVLYHSLPLIIIICIWINDTMAYLVGSFIGKTHFSKVSPKKTLEGTIGGVMFSVLAIALFAHFTTIMQVKDAGIIAVLCALFGTAGDLFESKLKRLANVKDSGSFMPGHGGFLDRFDSLLVATPFVWLYAKIFF